MGKDTDCPSLCSFNRMMPLHCAKGDCKTTLIQEISTFNCPKMVYSVDLVWNRFYCPLFFFWNWMEYEIPAERIAPLFHTLKLFNRAITGFSTVFLERLWKYQNPAVSREVKRIVESMKRFWYRIKILMQFYKSHQKGRIRSRGHFCIKSSKRSKTICIHCCFLQLRIYESNLWNL